MLPVGAPGPSRRERGERGRIGSVDGLRGIAAALVLLLHLFFLPYRDQIARASPSLWALLSKAACGVDLFFVISGFLIGGILLDWRGSPRLLPVFFRRRACRIVPLYYLLVVLAFLPLWVLPALDTAGRSAPAAAFFLFLNNLWSARGAEVPVALGVAWSLAIEEQFYVASALAVRFAPLAVVRAMLLAGVVAPPLLRGAIVATGFPLSPYDFTLCRLDGVCLGFLAAMGVRDEGTRRVLARLVRPGRHVLWLGAAGFAAFSQLSRFAGARLLYQSLWPTYVAVLCLAVLLAAVLRPDGPLSRAVQARPLLILGKYSYFLYLFHLCFGALAEEIVPNRLLAGGLALALVLAAAAVSFRVLESPLIEWSRRVPYG